MRKSMALLGVCGLTMGLALGMAASPASAQVTVDNKALLVASTPAGGAAGAVQSTGFTLKAADGTVIRVTTRPILNARLMSLAQQDTQVAMWDERRADGSIASMYSASLEGRAYSMPTEVSNQIRIRAGEFDPSVQQAAVPAELEAQPGNRMFMVQFATAFLPAYAAEIEALGGTVRRFIPDNAQLIELPADAVPAVEALPFVRGVAAYHPAYKLDEQILLDRFGWNALAQMPASATLGVMPSAEREAYNLLVVAENAGQQMRIADEVVALGGEVAHASDDDVLMTVVLDAAQLAEIASLDDVLWVDRWSPPSDDMDVVRITGGANEVETLHGITGQGVRGEVMDGNLRTSHVDFQQPGPPITFVAGFGSFNHGSSCFGIIFGDGTGDPSARGLAPDGQGIFSSYLNLGNRTTHTAALLNPPFFASFQSNSWGNQRTTQYNSFSAQMDSILFNTDITITQSQSNAGNQDSRPQAWAKNIISVGGINHYGNLTDADDCWCGQASRGPAADGRIKPDIALYYDNIYTTGGTSNTAYTSFCCTSAATPQVAGHIALMLQMWHEGLIEGYGAGGATVFQSRPSASLVKAMLLHSAQQWSFSGAGDLDRFRQGWGRPSLSNLNDMREDMFIVDEDEGTIAPLETMSWTFESDGSSKPNITMVYRDPAASPGASIHRINDLTLKVISPVGGIEFWGNNGMATSNFTTPGGGPDTINTVERMQINTAIPGTWEVQIIASEINQDGNPDTAGLDARFALIVSGLGQPVVPGQCPGDLNGDGVIDTTDLGTLLGAFGNSVTPGTGADLNGDGVVDTTDLGTLLGAFGQACG